jgi:hypothetical protein
MKPIRFLYQALTLSLWGGIVIAIFYFSDNRQVAAVFAGAGFILVPSVFLLFEARRSVKRHFCFLAAFLILAAWPIFLMRLIYWGEAFSELSLIGVPMSLLHRLSSILFVMMIFSALYGEAKEKTEE